MTAEYEYLHRVTFEETNLVGNVYFANFVRWQGHCREQFLYDHAPDVVSRLATRDLALVTLNAHVDYLSQAFAGDVVRISMVQLDAGRARHRVSMGFRYSRGAELLATGRQSVACMATGPDGTLEPVSTPESLASALGRFS